MVLPAQWSNLVTLEKTAVTSITKFLVNSNNFYVIIKQETLKDSYYVQVMQ